MLKRLQEQAAAGQQHNRERRFGDNQRMLEPVAARAGRAASAVTESFLRREPRSAQGGRDSESQRRSDGHGRRKRQHAPIEREARRAHGLGHEPFKKPHRGKGEGDSGSRTERGEHEASARNWTTSLPRRPHPRGADRDFTSARGTARQQGDSSD